jgi:hypothetical protein
MLSNDMGRPYRQILVLIACVGAFAYCVDQRKRQVAGFCEETGERLSDEQVLHRAGTGWEGVISVEIVPESALRAEEQIPAWVKQTGGFRAYVRVSLQEDPAAPDVKQRLLIISNCGDFRSQSFEWFGGWLW